MDDEQRAREVYEATRGRTERQGAAVAIRGAEIVRQYEEGPYTTQVTYRRRCDNCGYVPPTPPITISIVPYSTEAHGAYHTESFVCSFCGHRQIVEIQG